MASGVTGGEKLAVLLKKMAADISKANTVEIGFFETAVYPDGMNVATVAAIQEFGAPAVGIPPRPFFRNMIANESPHWAADVAAQLKFNDYDTEKTMAQMGEEIAGELRQSIVDTNDPALSPITLMIRKMKAESPDLVVTRATVGEAARRIAAGLSYSGVSTKPLVDTGRMLDSIGSRVKG